MLCNDVKDLIIQFAADRKLGWIYGDFIEVIEQLVHIHDTETLEYKSSMVEHILEESLEILSVTDSERNMWRENEGLYQLRFMIIRRMTPSMQEKHWAWVSKCTPVSNLFFESL